MKATILKLACEGCGQELTGARGLYQTPSFAVKLVYCSNGACKFYNQKFEQPTVELKAV